jgi:hypothetical protein
MVAMSNGAFPFTVCSSMNSNAARSASYSGVEYEYIARRDTKPRKKNIPSSKLSKHQRHCNPFLSE